MDAHGDDHDSGRPQAKQRPKTAGPVDRVCLMVDRGREILATCHDLRSFRATVTASATTERLASLLLHLYLYTLYADQEETGRPR